MVLIVESGRVGDLVEKSDRKARLNANSAGEVGAVGRLVSGSR